MLGGYIDGASVNLKSNWRQIMLTETELFQLCQNLNISQQAQQIITEIRLSPPVRPCFQNIQTDCVELFDHIAHCLVIAAQCSRYSPRCFLTGACQHNLAATYFKPIL